MSSENEKQNEPPKLLPTKAFAQSGTVDEHHGYQVVGSPFQDKETFRHGSLEHLQEIFLTMPSQSIQCKIWEEFWLSANDQITTNVTTLCQADESETELLELYEFFRKSILHFEVSISEKLFLSETGFQQEMNKFRDSFKPYASKLSKKNSTLLYNKLNLYAAEIRSRFNSISEQAHRGGLQNLRKRIQNWTVTTAPHQALTQTKVPIEHSRSIESPNQPLIALPQAQLKKKAEADFQETVTTVLEAAGLEIFHRKILKEFMDYAKAQYQAKFKKPAPALPYPVQEKFKNMYEFLKGVVNQMEEVFDTYICLPDEELEQSVRKNLNELPMPKKIDPDSQELLKSKLIVFSQEYRERNQTIRQIEDVNVQKIINAFVKNFTSTVKDNLGTTYVEQSVFDATLDDALGEAVANFLQVCDFKHEFWSKMYATILEEKIKSERELLKKINEKSKSKRWLEKRETRGRQNEPGEENGTEETRQTYPMEETFSHDASAAAMSIQSNEKLSDDASITEAPEKRSTMRTASSQNTLDELEDQIVPQEATHEGDDSEITTDNAILFTIGSHPKGKLKDQLTARKNK